MNGRLKNQAFFMLFNRLVFPWFYLGHWHKKIAEVRAGDQNRFKVRVHSSDILLIWEIWKFRIYDDPLFPIQPQDTIVDIGAHIGVFAVWAARRAPQGRVFAYEASRENYDLLVANKHLNQAGNLHTMNLAVYDRPGQYAFYQPGGNGALGSLLQAPNGDRETVTAVTLDELLLAHGLERIDFLKIDVEGAEYQILLHSSAAALHKIRYMVVEYHHLAGCPWGPQDVERHLQAHGFQVAIEAGLPGQRALFGTGIMKAWR